MIFGFSRLNHNLDFSFLHVKNPVGDFSPTGFVEQPKMKTVGLIPAVFSLCDFQSVTLRRCVTDKPPAMRVRVEGYTKKTPIEIQ